MPVFAACPRHCRHEPSPVPTQGNCTPIWICFCRRWWKRRRPLSYRRQFDERSRQTVEASRPATPTRASTTTRRSTVGWLHPNSRCHSSRRIRSPSGERCRSCHQGRQRGPRSVAQFAAMYVPSARQTLVHTSSTARRPLARGTLRHSENFPTFPAFRALVASHRL